jgi:hypothetical protein
MKFKVLVSRVCYQHQEFEVDVEHEGYVDTVAKELAVGFDWSDNPTVDCDFEAIDCVPLDTKPKERLVTVIFGEMEFDEDSCVLIGEDIRMRLPISKAEEVARDFVEKGLYENYVIPELYQGTLL